MDFKTLLDAAQSDPTRADYHALRMAYARSDAYAPYTHHSDAMLALRDALHSGNLDAAQVAINDLLAFNMLEIEVHMAADYVHTQLENRAASAYHRVFARGLIDAIIATGTGRDFASAFIVLSTSEEYVIQRVLGYKPQRQRLVEHNGHWFDVLTALHPDGGDPVELYFNIDLPYTWLHEQQQNTDHTDHDEEPPA